MLCTKMHLRAKIDRHAGAFTHRTFYTEKPLHRTVFTQNNDFAESFDTENLPAQTAQRRFYTPELLHAETLPRAAFTHKLFRVEAFTRRSLFAQHFFHRPFYPHMPLHRKTFTHRSCCTRHAFTHSQLLHGEALLPLLDHLLSCSPFQVV